MTIEGPVVVIFYAIITSVLIGQVFDYVLRRRRRKEMKAHLKVLDENMAQLRAKMQSSALELQESIAMINREYGDSIEEMTRHKSRLEQDIQEAVNQKESKKKGQKQVKKEPKGKSKNQASSRQKRKI